MSKKKKKKNVTLINAQLGIYLLTHCVPKFFFLLLDLSHYSSIILIVIIIVIYICLYKPNAMC